MTPGTAIWISDFLEDAKYGFRSFPRSLQMLSVAML